LQFLTKSIVFISKEKLVVARHSEGVRIVAKLGVEYPKITYVIRSGGDQIGRIKSMINRADKLKMA
jgi:hypothetical protein